VFSGESRPVHKIPEAAGDGKEFIWTEIPTSFLPGRVRYQETGSNHHRDGDEHGNRQDRLPHPVGQGRIEPPPERDKPAHPIDRFRVCQPRHCILFGRHGVRQNVPGRFGILRSALSWRTSRRAFSPRSPSPSQWRSSGWPSATSSSRSFLRWKPSDAPMSSARTRPGPSPPTRSMSKRSGSTTKSLKSTGTDYEPKGTFSAGDGKVMPTESLKEATPGFCSTRVCCAVPPGLFRRHRLKDTGVSSATLPRAPSWFLAGKAGFDIERERERCPLVKRFLSNP